MNSASIDRRLFSSLFLAGALAASIRPLGAATNARLLFVHGRGQAGLKADELKASWLTQSTRSAELEVGSSNLQGHRKQGGGLSGAAIEQFTRDVYLYTTRENVQKAVDDVIRADLTTSPTIVVAHSLGTVAAYNVLRNDARTLQIPLFVTLGSPLGIRAIRDKLMPLTFPKNTSSWYNAYDSRDVVALYPLDEANFPVKVSIANFGGVRNHTSNRHGIGGYLDDKHVARRLMDSLPS